MYFKDVTFLTVKKRKFKQITRTKNARKGNPPFPRRVPVNINKNVRECIPV